jgi:hypothetical protein
MNGKNRKKLSEGIFSAGGKNPYLKGKRVFFRPYCPGVFSGAEFFPDSYTLS